LREGVAREIIAFHRELRKDGGSGEGGHGQARRRSCRRWFEQGREEGSEIEGEADRWGRPVSDSKKNKRGRRGGELLREEGAGPAGLKGRKGEVFLFSFFKPFSNSNFSNFFQKHLKLLKLQTFTQNTMQAKYDAQALVVSKFN
jgi:hypothetical protein